MTLSNTIFNKLQDASISKEDFACLWNLEQQSFEETAMQRFSKLDNNLSLSHTDITLRLEINSVIREQVWKYIQVQQNFLHEQKVINLIEVGASLWAISSIYSLDALYIAGFIDKVQLTLLDICKHPLEETQKINFDIVLLHKLCQLTIPLEILKDIITNAEIITGNCLSLQESQKYTIALAPFTHHHLNVASKKLAVQQLEKITQKGWGIIVGDLFFTYESFIPRLQKHKNEKNSKGERVPYAIESFIPIEKHISLFENSNIVNKKEWDIFYCFSLLKK